MTFDLKRPFVKTRNGSCISAQEIINRKLTKLTIKNKISQGKENMLYILDANSSFQEIVGVLILAISEELNVCISSDIQALVKTLGIEIEDVKEVREVENVYSVELKGENRLDRKIGGHGGSIIFQTSGTTGNPKLVVQTRQSIINTAKDIINVCKINENNFECVYSPVTSAFFAMRVISIFLSGGIITEISKFNFGELIAILQEEKINSLSLDTTSAVLLIPTITDKIEGFYEKVRWIKLSSSNPTVEFKKLLATRFKNARIVIGYGLSEYMRACYQLIEADSEYINSEYEEFAGKPFPIPV